MHFHFFPLFGHKGGKGRFKEHMGHAVANNLGASVWRGDMVIKLTLEKKRTNFCQESRSKN